MPEAGCRSCGSTRLVPVLSLGAMPLANAFLKPEELGTPEPRFPLDAVFCADCALFQITETVPPDTLFREYVYVSSCSETFIEHVRALTERLVRDRSLDDRSLVVEIASNDGLLLSNYVACGIPVLGVEPARNIALLAEQRGVRTLPEFFGAALADDIAARFGRADVIHAHNVLAHVADLNGVIRGFARLLKDDGVAVIEAPYVRDMIDRVEFDAIYHEHLCYFSFTTLDHLARRHGMTIVDVERVPVHGGTLRLQLQLAGGPHPSASVHTLLDEERRRGIDGPDYYRDFAGQVALYRRNLADLMTKLRGEGARIAGYGAAAKSTTLLHACGIDGDTVRFIADRNPLKQGRYAPGTHIPIVEPKRLLAERPDYTLLLVWNFAEEVLRQQAEYRRLGGRFVIPALNPVVV